MNYYKIIAEDSFVGVGTSEDLRRYQAKHRIIVVTTEDYTQYIQHDEKLYKDDWMAPVTSDTEYIAAKVSVITESEYNAICEAIDGGEEVLVVEEEPIPEPAQDTETAEEPTIEFVRTAKIAALSRACNTAIVSGVDVVLEDGEAHHFSLTVEDQLNLISLQSLLATGQTHVPYHADGEACRYFSANDFIAVLTKATEWKIYHESYFNNLKAWVLQMDDIQQIGAVQYGDSIPEELYSDVMRGLINGQGS